MTRLNIIYILLLLITIIVAPVVDVFACDICKDHCSLPKRTEVRSTITGQSAGTPAHDAGTNTNAPIDSGAMNDHCPLCSNATSETKSFEGITPVLIVSVVSMPQLLSFPDPSYSIIKPPQN